MNDMARVIIPKSDQLNADDLIAGPMTITITGVDIRGGQEQPVSIRFEGDNGKPYKACKSMCRIMVAAWGADASKYTGRSLTLYRDPKVKWGGMEVGGIRISHMSHLEDDMTMALTMTRSNRKPFTVKPLAQQPTAAAPSTSPAGDHPPASTTTDAAAATINDEQEKVLIDLITAAGMEIRDFTKHAQIAKLRDLKAERYEGAAKWLRQKA